ncbi:Protein TBATA Protein SPATIAL [Channa argus]|uniref:Protein TBATA Protein SPATIAL n=1 Tax=Channa argus TaxID=215402 RepID=A0A6G1QPC8_CHAAH|nr:Protein TBATA Protein SPATIAL [Channa argus]
MSTAHSPESRRTTGETRQIQTNKVPFTPEFTKMLTKSSARFGALSHHSFFSRHNPHPHRVKHIQGLNGRPVCTSLYGFISTKNKSALLSEAWRDELKELAAKVNLTSQTQKEKKEDQPVEDLVRRKTQYSAATGRIIPPSTKSRRCHSQHLVYPQPFHDQELMVLELLCQILQTDSLSTVQQWLLLSGQREKDLVMGMIKQALDGVDLAGHQQNQFQSFHPGASADQSWRKPQKTSSHRMNQTSSDDKPEQMDM